jgi:hypothetical protein
MSKDHDEEQGLRRFAQILSDLYAPEEAGEVDEISEPFPGHDSHLTHMMLTLYGVTPEDGHLHVRRTITRTIDGAIFTLGIAICHISNMAILEFHPPDFKPVKKILPKLPTNESLQTKFYELAENTSVSPLVITELTKALPLLLFKD